MTRYEYEVTIEALGEDGDDIWCVLRNGRQVAGGFDCKDLAENWIAAATDIPGSNVEPSAG